MTDETALTKSQAADDDLSMLAGLDLDVGGLHVLEPGDVGRPPFIRLIQTNNETPEAPAGHFLNTLTGEVSELIEFVPLVLLTKSRVLWPKDFSRDNQPICASDDGVMSVTSSEFRPLTGRQPGPCATCPLGQFTQEAGGRKPPRCKIQRKFLVALLPDEIPAIITLQSTALGAAKQLTALSTAQGLRKSIVAHSRRVSDTRGNWHTWLFTSGSTLKAADIRRFVGMRDEMERLIAAGEVEVSADLGEPEAEGNGSPSAPIADAATLAQDIPF